MNTINYEIRIINNILSILKSHPNRHFSCLEICDLLHVHNPGLDVVKVSRSLAAYYRTHKNEILRGLSMDRGSRYSYCWREIEKGIPLPFPIENSTEEINLPPQVKELTINIQGISIKLIFEEKIK